jgi:hypothetical protein
MRTSISTYLHDRYSDQFWERSSHFAPHVRTSYLEVRMPLAAPGRSDQLHSYSETVGSDWSGRTQNKTPEL